MAGNSARVDEEPVIWARSFRKMYGTKIDPTEARIEDGEGVEDDPYADLNEDEAEHGSGRQDEDVT